MTDTVCSKMPSCQLSVSPTSLSEMNMNNCWFFNSFHVEYFYVLFFSNYYLVNLYHSSYKHVYTNRVENSVAPDQMASTVFSKEDIPQFSRKRVKVHVYNTKKWSYIYLISYY